MQNDFWGELTGSAGVRIAIIGVLAILALFLFAETASSVENFGRSATPPTNTITVQGTGRAAAAPDVATIDFTVTETAKDVAGAQQAATTRTQSALAAMKDMGISAADVRTLSYNVYPQYEYTRCLTAVCPPSTPTISGYQVSETIEVKIHDTSKAGAVLGKLGSLGVQNISGPNFTLDDPTAIQDQARGEAITKAQAQAKVLAKQLGVRLGSVVNFSENGNTPYPLMEAYGKGGGVSATPAVPELPPGQSEFTSTVSITYEIR